MIALPMTAASAQLPDPCNVLRSGDAEPDCKRKVRVPSHPGNEGRQLGRKLAAGARRPGHAHAVDEAARRPADRRQALFAARRGNHEDEVHLPRPHLAQQLLRLLGRQIDGYEAVNACFLCRFHEAGQPGREPLVVVPHQQNWHRDAGRAQAPRHIQADPGRDPVAERTPASSLDQLLHPPADRFEGHAQLDQVRAARDEAGGEIDRCFEVGVANRDVGEKPGAVFRFHAGECGRNTAHAQDLPWPASATTTPMRLKRKWAPAFVQSVSVRR